MSASDCTAFEFQSLRMTRRVLGWGRRHVLSEQNVGASFSGTWLKPRPGHTFVASISGAVIRVWSIAKWPIVARISQLCAIECDYVSRRPKGQ